LIKALPSGILAISLTAVYLFSMAPGLSWANYGADGGDLIAAAATGGVAHPSGYPVYLLLARLFQFMPIGSLAFRTNLMSAFATTAAALLVYTLITRTLSNSKAAHIWLAGLAAGFAYGLSPLTWSQAVITEVYALHSLFVVSILYLSVHPIPSRAAQWRIDLLLGLVFGLALGNHLTTLLLLPVIVVTTIHRKPTSAQGIHWIANWRLDGRSLLRRSSWLGIGLLAYLTLPLRALSKPPVNWGNPVNLTNLAWLVSGKLYQGQLFAETFSSLWSRVQTSASLLLQQFGIIGLAIGLIGLIVFFKHSPLYWSMLWITVASAAFAIAYSTTDSFMYLIPAFLCFAIWLGIGLSELMELSARRVRYIPPLIGLTLVVVLFVHAGNQWKRVDASHDQRAESFGENVLSIAPANAIVFARGDQAIFSLWYFQYALGERPDLAIVVPDLLQFDWYQQTLHATYPDLVLAIPFPFPETVIEANPERPVCDVQFIQLADISCSPARDASQR